MGGVTIVLYHTKLRKATPNPINLIKTKKEKGVIFIIKVIDSCCGTGKTTWAIQEMNGHPEQSYIFVTPFLDEVERIKQNTKVVFYEPTYKDNKRKIDDFNDLLCRGENIVTTHATFRNSNEDTIEYIQQGKYILILDEVIDIIEEFNNICSHPKQKVNPTDIKFLKNKSVITVDDFGKVSWIDDSYIDRSEKDRHDEDGTFKFADVEKYAKRGNLLSIDDTIFLWEFPQEIFSLFEETYVLTYIFEGSLLKPFFDYYKIEYELKGVGKKIVEVTDGKYKEIYCLVDYKQNSEDFQTYQKLISICDNEKLNNYKYNALSIKWYKDAKKIKDNGSEITRLRNNLRNFLRDKNNAHALTIMWTCPKEYFNLLKGKGYTNTRQLNMEERELPPSEKVKILKKLSCHVPCNARATNDFIDRHVLAYCCNMFYNPYIKKFFSKKNIVVNEDAFALSSIVQWVWRSRIRSNQSIILYIPSLRMRIIFKNWLYEIS